MLNFGTLLVKGGEEPGVDSNFWRALPAPSELSLRAQRGNPLD